MHNHTTFNPADILTWEKSPTYAGRKSTTPGNYHAIISRTAGTTLAACGITYPTAPDLPTSPDPIIRCRNCELAIGRQRLRLQRAQALAQKKAQQVRP